LTYEKNKVFVLVVFLVILGRLLDSFTTFIYTRDLKLESNIIVQWFGGKWLTIILIQIILLFFIFLFLYFYYFKLKDYIPQEKGLSFTQYISFFHFKNKNSFWKIFYTIPNDKIGYFSMLGYVCSFSIIFASYLVGLSTTLLILSEQYRNFYHHHIAIILYFLIILSVCYFTFRFYSIQYRKYLNSANSLQ